MNGDLQARINPPQKKTSTDFSAAKMATNPTEAATDGDQTTVAKTSFKDLIMGSNADVKRTRDAQKNGNEMTAAKTDEEFAKAMSNKLNSQMTRKPQNELDKDAFLKLFITQVQNQDPLNPDNSSQMAAQLAQFNGLEQMMNVNKNLEKMQSEAATARAVNLVSFVGKDLKLDTGKLRWAGGKLTDSTFKLDGDVNDLRLEARDSAGVVVSSEAIGTGTAGEHKLTWKGTDKTGKRIPDGVYTFSMVGKDAQGTEVAAKITSAVKVTGVDLKDAGGAFYTDVGKVGIQEVSSVGDTGFVGKAAEGDAKKMTDAMKAAAQAGGQAVEGMMPGENAAGEQKAGQDGDKKPEIQAADGVKAVEAPKEVQANESKVTAPESAPPPVVHDTQAVNPSAMQRVPYSTASAMGPGALEIPVPKS